MATYRKGEEAMKLEVFDPPMCCSSGVCGPEVDPALLRFSADLDVLKGQGVEVIRHNLAQEPLAFARNETVRAALQEDERSLPLVLLNGRVIARGAYPPAELLAVAIGEHLSESDADTAPSYPA